MKDGGSAFPIIGKHSPEGRMEIDSPGMALRDWFAGQALSGFSVIFPECGEIVPKSAAEWCYRMADAMIAQREAGIAKEAEKA